MQFNPRFVTTLLISLTLTSACHQNSKSRNNEEETTHAALAPDQKDKPKTTKKKPADTPLDPQAETKAAKAAEEAALALNTELEVERKTEIFLNLVRTLKLPKELNLETVPGYPKKEALQKSNLKDCKIIKAKLHSGPENLITKDMKGLNMCWGKSATFEQVPNLYLSSQHIFVNELLNKPKEGEPTGQEIVQRNQQILFNSKLQIVGISQNDLLLNSREITTRTYLGTDRIAAEKRVTQIKDNDSVVQLTVDQLQGVFKYSSTVKRSGSNSVEARYKLTYVTNPVRKLSIDYQEAVLNEKSECQVRVLEGEKVVFENVVESCGFAAEN